MTAMFDASPPPLARQLSEVMEKAKATVEERNATYSRGASFGFQKHAAMMVALFPEGMSVQTEEEWARLILFIMATTKVCRYAENIKDGGHDDSAHDLAIYSFIMQAHDQLKRSGA